MSQFTWNREVGSLKGHLFRAGLCSVYFFNCSQFFIFQLITINLLRLHNILIDCSLNSIIKFKTKQKHSQNSPGLNTTAIHQFFNFFVLINVWEGNELDWARKNLHFVHFHLWFLQYLCKMKSFCRRNSGKLMKNSYRKRSHLFFVKWKLLRVAWRRIFLLEPGSFELWKMLYQKYWEFSKVPD